MTTGIERTPMGMACDLILELWRLAEEIGRVPDDTMLQIAIECTEEASPPGADILDTRSPKNLSAFLADENAPSPVLPMRLAGLLISVGLSSLKG
jgi:hypothetical protein